MASKGREERKRGEIWQKVHKVEGRAKVGSKKAKEREVGTGRKDVKKRKRNKQWPRGYNKRMKRENKERARRGEKTKHE